MYRGVLYCHCYMQGRAVLCHCVMCRGGAASPTVEVETAAPVDGDSDWAEDMPQEEEDSGGEDSVSCPPTLTLPLPPLLPPSPPASSHYPPLPLPPAVSTVHAGAAAVFLLEDCFVRRLVLQSLASHLLLLSFKKQ